MQKLPWEACTREDMFLAHQEPWKSMRDPHKRRLGSIMNPIRYLSFSVKADRTQVQMKPNVIWLQFTHVDDRLPDVEKELTLSLDDAIKSGTGVVTTEKWHLQPPSPL
jgi:hypothetical protein